MIASTQSFCAFCATVSVPETKQTNIGVFTTHVIPDEEDDESFQEKDPVEIPTEDETNQAKIDDEVMTAAAKTTVVDMGPTAHVILDDKEPTSLDPHDELLG